MIEHKIHYTFKDKNLLETALTHASVQKARHNNNENFEFLGDRVLGLIIADILFSSFPNEKEGMLAKRHTALVNQDALYQIACALKLEEDIVLSAGEAKTGGQKKQAILADAVEAIIGAIYKDGGFDKAFKFVETSWQEMINAQTNPPEDAKSALQEWAQGKGLPLPSYKVIGKSGEDHEPMFTIEVTVETLGSASATANSKKHGEKMAAEILLQQLKDKKEKKKK